MPTMETTTFPSVCADVAPTRLGLPSSRASSSGAAAEAEPSAAAAAAAFAPAIPGAARGNTRRAREGGRRGEASTGLHVAKLDS